LISELSLIKEVDILKYNPRIQSHHSQQSKSDKKDKFRFNVGPEKIPVAKMTIQFFEVISFYKILLNFSGAEKRRFHKLGLGRQKNLKERRLFQETDKTVL
jgi:hypothetical protein